MRSFVVNQFGDPQLPKKITNKAQARGTPLKEDNASAQAENFNENGYDPHSWVRRFPDGTQIVVCFGKNPRVSVHHASGTSHNIYPDGSVATLVSGNHFNMVKGGVTSTVEGHSDVRYGGHVRENVEGGHYKDVKGDHAVHVSGNSVTHTVGSRTDNVHGNYTLRSNKSFSFGAQDDSGQLMMSIYMNNGVMQIQAKGDVEIASRTGSLKLKGAKGVSIHSDADVALDAGGKITHSADKMTADIKKLVNINSGAINTTPLPPGYGVAVPMQDKSVHDGIASSQTTYSPTNTIDTA